MTDEEEMARLYLIEKYGLRRDIELDIIEHGILSIEFCTYLAGLKAGEKLGFEKGMSVKVNTTTISDYTAKAVGHSEGVICSLSADLDYAKTIIQNLLDSLIDIDGKQIRELKAVKEAVQLLKEAEK